MDPAVVSDIGDGDAGLIQFVGVGLPFISQHIFLSCLDQRRGQVFQGKWLYVLYWMFDKQ